MNGYWINILPFGEENAIHLSDLANRLHIHPSKVKAEIKKARISGIEICSSQAGYFIPKNDFERQRFVRMQEKGARSRFKTSKVIKNALKNSKGQMKIDDIAGGVIDE